MFEHLFVFGQSIWLPKINAHASPNTEMHVYMSTGLTRMQKV